MLKKIFGNLVIDVKVYYTNIFLVFIPFFTIMAVIIIPLFQNPDFVRENRLLILVISLVNLTLLEKVSGKYFASNNEAEIDRMVYQLYDLTSEEIAIVEGEFEK